MWYYTVLLRIDMTADERCCNLYMYDFVFFVKQPVVYVQEIIKNFIILRTYGRRSNFN